MPKRAKHSTPAWWDDPRPTTLEPVTTDYSGRALTVRERATTEYPETALLAARAGWDVPEESDHAVAQSSWMVPAEPTPARACWGQQTAPAAVVELEIDPAPLPHAVSGRFGGEEVIDARISQFAGMFAIDYLSWDEDRPTGRSEALRQYLPDGACLPGWTGWGRQRASSPVPGRAERRPSDPDVVWVDVQTMVTPYQRDPRTQPNSTVRATPGPLPGRPCSSPAPDAPGWICEPTRWVHLDVPVRRLSSGDLVIDTELADTELATTDLDGAELGAGEHLNSRGA